ncbi:MAG: response regulator [Opitutaceae bacterium]
MIPPFGPAGPQILLLDDDPTLHRAVEFRLRGFAQVALCRTGEEALAKVRGQLFDAALVDVNLGEGPSGLEWVGSLREADPDLAMVVFTAHGEYDTALESFRRHCFDFIPKNLRRDDEFRSKLAHAVEHTRAQRGRSRSSAEAGVLRTALADAVVSGELEVSASDIQRGLLSTSLDSLSALLGRVELINLRLAEPAARRPEDTATLEDSLAATAELQETVERLRDYLAAPEVAVRSINEILAQAVRIVGDEGPEGVRIVRDELAPDARFAGEGRALLRAVVILLRLMLKALNGSGVVNVRPALMLDVAADLRAFRSRPGVRILHTPNFKRDSRVAVAIDLCGSDVGAEPETIARLFSPAAPLKAGPSAWSAVAMLARAGALLGAEWGSGVGLRYRIVVKV